MKDENYHVLTNGKTSVQGVNSKGEEKGEGGYQASKERRVGFCAYYHVL